MSVLKKRSFAAAVTALLIALSVIFGAHRSLMSLYTDVAGVFENGSSGDGYGIRYDLNERAGFAFNLATVAKRYMAAGDARITALEAAANELREASGVYEAYMQNNELTRAALELYSTLGGYTLTDTDARYRESIMTDLESGELRISHSDYNEKAREFNKTLDKFPANILGAVTSVDRAELFGDEG